MTHKDKQKLVLYGAGDYGKKCLNKIGIEKVFAFADSNKAIAGNYIENIKILSAEELFEIKDESIIYPSVALDKRESVIQSIVQKGLGERIIYSPYYPEVKTGFNAFHGLNFGYEGKNYLASYSYIDNSQIGYASYIGSYSKIDRTIIGKYTSIGPNVHIIRGQHPAHRFVSTHPAFYSIDHTIGLSYVDKQLFEEYRYVQDDISVKIGNDVWIGDSVKIMEGITIADGTIIASGAMVVKNTEPYSIVGGVPGRILSYRFDVEEINFLLNLKWWNKEEEWIRQNAKYFDDINKLKDLLEK